MMRGRVVPRAAVFQANWPLQVHTSNVVEELRLRGYEVDVFLFGVARDFAELAPDGAATGVRVFDLSADGASVGAARAEPARAVAEPPRRRARAAGLRRRLGTLREIARFWLRIDDLGYVLAPSVFDETERRMGGAGYRIFIGIEREGLIWAGEMGRRRGVPTAYFSLELYTNDAPNVAGRRDRRVKRLEGRYHRAALATIVQDAPRARILLDDNAVRSSEVFLVPVSLRGAKHAVRTHYLHDRLGLPRETRIVLVLGQVHAKRYTHDAVRAAQQFPGEWALVVHGPTYNDHQLMSELQALNTGGRARFSTEIIPEEDLGALVASADIGLALYSPDTVNEYWTGRASEKAARYAQAGVPMIAFDYPSFREVFEGYRCGRVVTDLSHLRDEAAAIFADYPAYRAGAFRAYDEVYEFSRQFAPVVDRIDQL